MTRVGRKYSDVACLCDAHILYTHMFDSNKHMCIYIWWHEHNIYYIKYGVVIMYTQLITTHPHCVILQQDAICTYTQCDTEKYIEK